MKLQPASQKELSRVAIGTVLCTFIMLAVFAALGAAGVVTFDYTIPLSAVLGAVIAIVNFALLCLTVQGVAGMADAKNARAKMQLSYNGRMMFQTVWCVVAFVAPCFNVFAAALPLLFPRIAIFFGQMLEKNKRDGTAKAEPEEETAPPAVSATEDANENNEEERGE